jgi:hypothetical protein
MLKHVLTGILAGWVVAIVAGLAVVWAGVPNVGAGWQDPPPLRWLLHTAYERSVARRAAEVVVPPLVDDPGQALAGARAFEQMCAICHTPPGEEPTVQSAGLNPPPPRLVELASMRTPAQAFWVIKNGVRMTAMPAFGLTHTDAQLWQLVTFLQRARDLDGPGYEALQARARHGLAGDGHAHRHGTSAEAADTQESGGDHDHDEGTGHAH